MQWMSLLYMYMHLDVYALCVSWLNKMYIVS